MSVFSRPQTASGISFGTLKLIGQRKITVEEGEGVSAPNRIKKACHNRKIFIKVIFNLGRDA